MVAVYPEWQIVEPMSAWVTAGFTAPGLTFHAGRYAPAGPRAAALANVGTTGLALDGALDALGVAVGVADTVGGSLVAADAVLCPAAPLAAGSHAVRVSPRSTLVPRTPRRVLMFCFLQVNRRRAW